MTFDESACARDGLRTDDIVIPQGADFTWQWPVVDQAGAALPSWTGWTARCQARERVTSADPLAEWTTENGGIELVLDTDDNGDPVSGLNLVTTPAMSTPWTWRHGVYDIELVSPTGKVTPLSSGTITIRAEVTR